MDTVEHITESNRTEVDAYLSQHEDTAQFLVNNLKAHGPQLTAHHNSGNFKLIRSDGQVKAVFCLARRGNLIVQSNKDFSEMILQSCADEEVVLKGFIGDWNSVEPIYRRYRLQRPEYKPSYESKEILYSYALKGSDPNLVHDSRVRFLEQSDFSDWLQHSTAYMSELRLPDELTLEKKKADFEYQVQERIWWGLFYGERLLSRAALNSRGEKIGQVGGVFTPPEYRQRGYAKATMFHMLKDCRDLHGHTKNILFTGEIDIPAQKLYESMGYVRVGSFALILG